MFVSKLLIYADKLHLTQAVTKCINGAAYYCVKRYVANLSKTK